MNKVMAAFKRCRSYEHEITAQLEHIERLHRIGAIAKKSSAYSLEIIEKLNRLEAELNEQIDKSIDAKREALIYLSLLDGEERSVIERYYILGEDWYRIADKLYMSERRVYLLRKSALKHIEQKLKKEVFSNGNRPEDKRAAGA